jgi:hypothetical protein
MGVSGTCRCTAPQRFCLLAADACLCLLLQLGGQWASGRPFLNAEAKQTDTPWDAGLALPLVALDVSELKVGLPCPGWPGLAI